jgi:hypothetical protein
LATVPALTPRNSVLPRLVVARGGWSPLGLPEARVGERRISKHGATTGPIWAQKYSPRHLPRWPCRGGALASEHAPRRLRCDLAGVANASATTRRCCRGQPSTVGGGQGRGRPRAFRLSGRAARGAGRPRPSAGRCCRVPGLAADCSCCCHGLDHLLPGARLVA